MLQLCQGLAARNASTEEAPWLRSPGVWVAETWESELCDRAAGARGGSARGWIGSEQRQWEGIMVLGVAQLVASKRGPLWWSWSKQQEFVLPHPGTHPYYNYHSAFFRMKYFVDTKNLKFKAKDTKFNIWR